MVKQKSGKTLRRSTAADVENFGERLRNVRLSLDPEGEPEVSLAAMNRVFADNPKHRHKWRLLELETSASPDILGIVKYAFKKLVSKLEIDNEEKAAEMLLRYVRAESDKLPWSSPPKWKPGQSPVKRPGRPHGSRLLGTSRLLAPGQDPSALVAQALPQAQQVMLGQIPEVPTTVLAVLEDVRHGRIPTATAALILRSLLSSTCAHGQPAQEKGAGKAPLTTIYRRGHRLKQGGDRRSA
jgi:hypothetical protein